MEGGAGGGYGGVNLAGRWGCVGGGSALGSIWGVILVGGGEKRVRYPGTIERKVAFGREDVRYALGGPVAEADIPGETTITCIIDGH